MKKLLLTLFFYSLTTAAFANHLVGGELFYTHKSTDAYNNVVYRVTLRFFRNMESSVPSIGNEPVYVGVYENNALIRTVRLLFEKVDTIRSKSFPECLDPDLQTAYEIGYFSLDVTLPLNASGYMLSWIRCCRTNSVANMNLTNGGITLTTEIPGTVSIAARPNNSAIFELRDTVLLCNDRFFSINSGATDADGDSLTYRFYPALHGASDWDPGPQPDPSIQIIPLSYKTPQFSETAPMGANVKLDPLTGTISGIAPAAGTYLVTIRVYEWRNQKLINQHSKDILLKVRTCSYSPAQLKPEYAYCDTTGITFQNELAGNDDDTWFWDFGIEGINSNTSDLPTPGYNYLQAGTYTVTLVVNKNKSCPSTARAKVQIFPGLKSGFKIQDSCVQQSVHFTDTSFYSNGIINRWSWNFGDPLSPGNTSQVQHPVHTYNLSGNKTIRLITGTDKGCTDTTYGQVYIRSLPEPSLLQGDTSLCKGDTLQLKAQGSGSFSWTPAINISSTSDAKVIVYPSSTISYAVTVNDGYCSNKDSVKLTVLTYDPVSIKDVQPICDGDSLQLHLITAASDIQWMPAITGNSMDPVIFPHQDMVYKVITNTGVCQAEDSIFINVRNVPTVFAGTDIRVNEGQPVQLSATGADFYQWSPRLGLSSPSISDPLVVLPEGRDSITYVVKGDLANGCSAYDTVTVYVNIISFADAPTAFTPDANGKNDSFRPVVKGSYSLVDFVVYNRWGQQLFRTTELGKGWDGKTGGTENSTGVYVWVLRVKNKITNGVVQKKGTVVLIK